MSESVVAQSLETEADDDHAIEEESLDSDMDLISDTANPHVRDRVVEYRVQRLPRTCGVSDTSKQDPMMVDSYLNLPKLVRCRLHPWAPTPGPGQFRFSYWAEQCPDMSLDFCLSIMNFVKLGRFINPARADPRITTSLKVTANSPLRHLMMNAEPAILISTIYCTESHLLAPPGPPTALRRKYISGISHSQEWERQTSFISMAFGHSALHAQLLSDAMSYSTTIEPPSHGFQGQQLPPVAIPPGIMALRVSDQVPIYDARFTPFRPNADWEDLESLLPQFMAEVPSGSCVVVGYTCDCAFRRGLWRLSTNIRFAVVLGTP